MGLSDGRMGSAASQRSRLSVSPDAGIRIEHVTHTGAGSGNITSHIKGTRLFKSWPTGDEGK